MPAATGSIRGWYLLAATVLSLAYASTAWAAPVSGEPLFTSVSKYDSHIGWPSVTVPVEPGHVIVRRDCTHWMIRTEVRSAHGDSHLGYVFRDGARDRMIMPVVLAAGR